jgi:plasmid stabilization system protein ParE
LELEEIGDHIAEDSPANAERFIERLTRKFVALGRNPRIGRAVGICGWWRGDRLRRARGAKS